MYNVHRNEFCILIDKDVYLSNKKGSKMPKSEDLRYIRTNQLLCTAFKDLLEKKKFEDITIQELCDQAFIRRATFYTHFIDKYDFFTYFIKHQRDIFYACWNGDIQKNKNNYFIFMFEKLIDYIVQHEAMINHVINSNAFPILLSILSDLVYEDVIQELEEVQDTNPEIIAAFYSGGFIRILEKWVLNKEKKPKEELKKEVENFLYCIHI